MILFFFGPNDYLVSRKVYELKQRYLEKAGGDFNFLTLDGATLVPQDYLRQIMAMPLLSSSRLIVVENILKNKNKEVLEMVKNSLDKVSSSTVVLFVQKGDFDRRLGLFRALNRPKIAQEFKSIEPYKMPRFVTEEVEEKGGKIEKDAANLLSEFVGDDLWRLSNEIDKLLSFTGGIITSSDVETLVVKNITSNIFAMIDDLSRDLKGGALKHLDALLKSNEPPLRILSLINFQFRSIAQIKEAMEASSNQFAISKTTKLSPFQISKSFSLAKKFSFSRLSQVYSEIVRVDFEIKTGKIEDAEGLRDLVLAV